MAKRMMRAALSSMVAIVFALVAGIASPAAAYAVNPAVVYDGTAHGWYGEGLTSQDVIVDASGVMPGDSLAQEYDLAARNVRRGVTISLRAEADPHTASVLADAEIVLRDADGGVVAQGTLGDLVGKDVQPLAIGTFEADSAIHMRTELLIPTHLGNELQGEAHEIRWVYVAQEDGDTVSADSNDLLVQMGDSPLSVYGPLVLGLLGVAVIVIAVVLRRRKR